MKKAILAGLLIALILPCPSAAQDPKALTNELSQRWGKKPAKLFVATNAYDIRVNFDGKPMDELVPACERYADVVVDDVKVSSKELRIHATRTAIGTDRRYNGFPYDVLVRAALPVGWTDGDVEALVIRIFTPKRMQLPLMQTLPNVHKPGSGIAPPKGVFTPDPEMTEEARRAKAGGNAVIEFTVNEDGTVSDVVPLTTDPYGFARAAAATTSNWRFTPATLNGTPVKLRVRSESSFCMY